MYGDADRVCPMETVEWAMSRIGHMVYGNYQFGGYDHADFGKANDAVFMGELHEALSHLQPHLGLLAEEDMFQADLSRALEQEYVHESLAEELALSHELGHHLEPVHFTPGYAEPMSYGGSEIVIDEPSWRDDKYHDHAGFDLQ